MPGFCFPFVEKTFSSFSLGLLLILSIRLCVLCDFFFLPLTGSEKDDERQELTFELELRLHEASYDRERCDPLAACGLRLPPHACVLIPYLDLRVWSVVEVISEGKRRLKEGSHFP